MILINILLSDVSLKKINLFLDNYKNEINQYLLLVILIPRVTKNYNLSLSIKRAEIVKDILINYGIKENNIKILAKVKNL